MKFLSAPWRWDFITGKISNKGGCVLCAAQKKQTQESLVCFIGQSAYVILNRYPYNSGHLMVVPNQHTDSPLNLDSQVTGEVWELMKRSVEVLKKCFNPDGFNIGMNLGRAAGAGIEAHCHLHIVPRWQGDSNFMAAIAGTDVHSFDIRKIYEIIYNEFNERE
jgi:ATP adenylyltransferase